MKGKVLFFLWFPLCCQYLFVRGYDEFEGLSPGAFCFKPRPISGCNGTLLKNFTPKAKGVGINEPNTLVFLFTPRNPLVPEYLHNCGGRLPADTNFDRRQKTEIFIHGWLDGTCRTAWMRECRDQLFIKGQYNVIFIDWTWGNGFDYYNGAANTGVVGEQVAFVINNIVTQTGVSPETIHIIGHSFGSHIAGFAGQIIPNLGRITGLDPALAPFYNKPPNERLDRTDAKLVDNIHSGGGSCSTTSIGDITPLGDADFYPNGGRRQLSCVPYIVISLLKLDVLWAIFTLIPNFCNHLHATQYYKVSINPENCDFVGVKCTSYQYFQAGGCRSCGRKGSNCAVMGMDFDKYFHEKGNATRKYYLDTTLTCPYCDNRGLVLRGFPRQQQLGEEEISIL